MKSLPRMSSRSRQFLNFSITFTSALLCLLILPTRMPGMELLGIGPNWVLMWVVAWSIKRKRTILGAAIMGLILGFLQDAMTAPHPSHAVSLVIVAVLTVVLLKTWSIPADIVEKDPIPIALIVFGMAMLAETVMGIQFFAMGDRALMEVSVYHQRVALSSAILSSLWVPVLYFPLNRLWEMTKTLEKY